MKRSCSFLLFQTLQEMNHDPPKKRRIDDVGDCVLRYETGPQEVVDFGKGYGIDNASEIRDTKPFNGFNSMENHKEERGMDIEESSDPHPTNCTNHQDRSKNDINPHQSCEYRRPQFKRRGACFRRRKWGKKKKQRNVFFESAVLCM